MPARQHLLAHFPDVGVRWRPATLSQRVPIIPFSGIKNQNDMPIHQSSMIENLVKGTYDDFVRQKRAAAVHFDAAWDGHRHIVRTKMIEAAKAFGTQVNLGEVDCDREMELARSLRLLTVPTVVYYFCGNVAAVLPGARQNVLKRLERLLAGQPIGRTDGLD